MLSGAFSQTFARTQTNGALASNEILGRIDGSIIRIANFVFDRLTKGLQSHVLESGEQVRKSESLVNRQVIFNNFYLKKRKSGKFRWNSNQNAALRPKDDHSSKINSPIFWKAENLQFLVSLNILVSFLAAYKTFKLSQVTPNPLSS